MVDNYTNTDRMTEQQDIQEMVDKLDKIERTEKLSAMQKAEKLIGEIEQEKTIFNYRERNLIVNYMYKFDDMDKTRELAEKLVYMIENDPMNAVLAVIGVQAEIDRLPDGTVGLSEMHEYGYTWNEMLPLTRERAMELFGENVSIYQLHADGSETIVEEVNDFSHEGMFGVEKADWNAYLEQQERKAILGENLAERETQLLQGSENWFGIYQLKDSPQTEEVRFMNSDFWEMKGVAIAKEHYQLVYTAPLKEGMTLEDIFTKFNIDHPEDFKGHSLSVSDVVVLHQNGKNTSHFVDSFGYKEVSEFIQTKKKMEELQKEEATQEIVTELEEKENDRVSYYVIEDISTWAENSPEKSKLERFDSFTEALEQFQTYRKKDGQFHDDKARTTFGVNVHGIEFDVIHARNNENVLSLDFTHSSEALQSQHFMDDLQILCNELVDKVRVHREMASEEVKQFVKDRLEYQLHSNGLEDISVYMNRFDTLYEQGKMEHLMPTTNQKHIVEDIPITEWENEYISISERNEPQEMAFSVGDKFICIQSCTEGYDYSIFLADYTLFDSGVYDNPNITIHVALKDILENMGVLEQEKLIPVDYEELMEKSEAVEQAESIQATCKEQMAILAADINEIAFLSNPKQYEEFIINKEAHIMDIQEHLEKGDTEYISKFLNAVITNSIRDGVTDIFGKGMQPDDSTSVQMARKAKALLDRVEECKLSTDKHIEDNLSERRISVKEKLAEKRIILETKEKTQRSSIKEKVHREI